MEKSPYDIIRMFVERIILPKYPFLRLYDVDSYNLTNNRIYDVRFITKTKPEPEIQQEIDIEIKNLFKLASLDEKERYLRNKIMVWFKTPHQKDWTFHSLPNYEH